MRIDEAPEVNLHACVCHVGGRSATADDALNRGGWKAVNMAGGMVAWAAAGLPVVDDAGRPGAVS